MGDKDIREKLFKECPECKIDCNVIDVQPSYFIQRCPKCLINWKIRFDIEEL